MGVWGRSPHSPPEKNLTKNVITPPLINENFRSGEGGGYFALEGTPIQPRKEKHQTNNSLALKRFRTTCGVSDIIAKLSISALPKNFSVGNLTEMCLGEQKLKFMQLYQRRRK